LEYAPSTSSAQPQAGLRHPRRHASRRAGVVSRDIGEFITWFNTEIATVIAHPTIDDDPDGKIIAPRLRRTLAWHIVRRPGGTIAGAIRGQVP